MDINVSSAIESFVLAIRVIALNKANDFYSSRFDSYALEVTSLRDHFGGWRVNGTLTTQDGHCSSWEADVEFRVNDAQLFASFWDFDQLRVGFRQITP